MTQNNWSTGVITFSFGVGVGALLALLFAPSSGKETREHIVDTLDQGLNDATSTAKRWARRAQDTVDEVTASVTGAVEAGEKAYRAARDA